MKKRRMKKPPPGFVDHQTTRELEDFGDQGAFIEFDQHGVNKNLEEVREEFGIDFEIVRKKEEKRSGHSEGLIPFQHTVECEEWGDSIGPPVVLGEEEKEEGDEDQIVHHVDSNIPEQTEEDKEFNKLLFSRPHHEIDRDWEHLRKVEKGFDETHEPRWEDEDDEEVEEEE